MEKNDMVPVEETRILTRETLRKKDKRNRKFETIKLGSYLISGHHCLVVDEDLE
jgi:hypothetical protein